MAHAEESVCHLSGGNLRDSIARRIHTMDAL